MIKFNSGINQTLLKFALLIYRFSMPLSGKNKGYQMSKLYINCTVTKFIVINTVFRLKLPLFFILSNITFWLFFNLYWLVISKTEQEKIIQNSIAFSQVLKNCFRDIKILWHSLFCFQKNPTNPLNMLSKFFFSSFFSPNVTFMDFSISGNILEIKVTE